MFDASWRTDLTPPCDRMVYRDGLGWANRRLLPAQTLISRTLVPQGSDVSMPFSIDVAGAPA